MDSSVGYDPIQIQCTSVVLYRVISKQVEKEKGNTFSTVVFTLQWDSNAYSLVLEVCTLSIEP